MCRGISSPGSATIPSGNSGNSSLRRSDIPRLVYGGGWRRYGLRLTSCQQEVVEHRWGEEPLKHLLIDSLEQEVAVERVLSPQHRDLARVGARLQGAVEPAEPVRHQLLAADL